MNRLIPLLLMLALQAPALAKPYQAPTLPERPPAPEVHTGKTERPKPMPMPLVSRGRMLYENHCTACHESVVLIREHRAVKDMAGLHATVARWAKEAKAPWGAGEIDAVVEYLNQNYYHFPEP